MSKHLMFKHKATKSEALVGLSEGMRAFVRSLEKYRVLTIDEENEMFRRWINERDEVALDTIIKTNARFVVYVALRIAYKNIDDVIQAGMVGLVRSANRYTPCGYRFISYAAYFIYDEIHKCIRAMSKGNSDVRLDDKIYDDSENMCIADTISDDDNAMEVLESRSSADYMMRQLRDRFGDESVELLNTYFNMDNRSKSDICVKANNLRAKVNRDRYMRVLYKKYKNKEI